MDAVAQFVAAVCSLSFKDAFNPYIDRCPVHDKQRAPERRREALQRTGCSRYRGNAFVMDRPRSWLPGRTAYGSSLDRRCSPVDPCR